jgi:hypothetical protein
MERFIFSLTYARAIGSTECVPVSNDPGLSGTGIGGRTYPPDNRPLLHAGSQ